MEHESHGDINGWEKVYSWKSEDKPRTYKLQIYYDWADYWEESWRLE